MKKESIFRDEYITRFKALCTVFDIAMIQFNIRRFFLGVLILMMFMPYATSFMILDEGLRYTIENNGSNGFHDSCEFCDVQYTPPLHRLPLLGRAAQP